VLRLRVASEARRQRRDSYECDDQAAIEIRFADETMRRKESKRCDHHHREIFR
jgi:hypothetical protein